MFASEISLNAQHFFWTSDGGTSPIESLIGSNEGTVYWHCFGSKIKKTILCNSLFIIYLSTINFLQVLRPLNHFKISDLCGKKEIFFTQLHKMKKTEFDSSFS